MSDLVDLDVYYSSTHEAYPGIDGDARALVDAVVGDDSFEVRERYDNFPNLDTNHVPGPAVVFLGLDGEEQRIPVSEFPAQLVAYNLGRSEPDEIEGTPTAHQMILNDVGVRMAVIIREEVFGRRRAI